MRSMEPQTMLKDTVTSLLVPLTPELKLSVCGRLI